MKVRVEEGLPVNPDIALLSKGHPRQLLKLYTIGDKGRNNRESKVSSRDQGVNEAKMK
jgi:hypothetical protein